SMTLFVYRIGPGPRPEGVRVLYPVVQETDSKVVTWVESASDVDALARVKEIAEGREVKVEPALSDAGANFGFGTFPLRHAELCDRAHLSVSGFCGGILDE